MFQKTFQTYHHYFVHDSQRETESTLFFDENIVNSICFSNDNFINIDDKNANMIK
jgi:hypothetical protein